MYDELVVLVCWDAVDADEAGLVTLVVGDEVVEEGLVWVDDITVDVCGKTVCVVWIVIPPRVDDTVVGVGILEP